MQLDHVSYVSSHDQLADSVQRIGSQLDTAFVDGGIHPQFGTRNFTAPLLNGQYIEIVAALDHPSAEQTPFGRAVIRKSQMGGGWLSWVFSTDAISGIEAQFGRKSIVGHRRKPDGTELRWQQLGVLDLLETPEAPFFVQWHSDLHPSNDGVPASKITSIALSIGREFEGPAEKAVFALKKQNISLTTIFADSEDERGISRIAFETKHGLVSID